MAAERVDIIVIGYNEERFLAKCLESVRIASKRLERECLVVSRTVYVDSHSTDQSVSIAQSAGVSVRFAPLGFRAPSNGRMAGLLQTNGEYIMFLDGDMELKPDFLGEALKFLREHPEAAGLRGIWDDLQYRAERPVLVRNIDKVGAKPTSRKAYFAGAFFARRKAIEQVGGYEVCLPIQEEVTLYCKLRQAGWMTYRIPIPMITHFNVKVSSPKHAISHMLIGRRPLISGVLFRHAVMSTRWWPTLLHYQLPQIFHGAFLVCIGGLTSWSLCADSETLTISAGIFVLSSLYVLLLVREKGGVSRGLAALVLRTIYFVNFCGGFLFYYPKLAFRFQNSEEYRQMVMAANKGCGPSGTEQPSARNNNSD